eukprot:2014008-Rhodomonas_salina.1
MKSATDAGCLALRRFVSALSYAGPVLAPHLQSLLLFLPRVGQWGSHAGAASAHAAALAACCCLLIAKRRSLVIFPNAAMVAVTVAWHTL